MKIALVLLLTACAGHRPPRPTVDATVSGAAPALRTLQADGVAVAPVVLVRDLPAPPLPPTVAPGRIEEQLVDPELGEPTPLDPERDAVFLRGDYVGNVRFGGGVLLAGDVGLQARARILEFGAEAEYGSLGAAWLADSVDRALDARGVPRDVTAAPPDLTVDRTPFRGLHEDDGRDNVNLPRMVLRPGRLAPMPDAPRPWVLVPYLRVYYTHNGGWFLGQQYGTMAGARVEAIVALYDARTGAPVWWMDALGRHLDAATASPSTAQLDQYLLWAEDDVEAALDEGLFRAKLK